MVVSLDGGPVARDILAFVREEIGELVTRHVSIPQLAVIMVGNDPGSAAYARAIRRTSRKVDIPLRLVELPDDTSLALLDQTISTLNEDPNVAGIMVLQPLPRHLPKLRPSELIDPQKDVDGITLENLGRLEAGQATLVPSTPQGGIEILHHYDIPVAGRHVVVIGRSLVVGKPLATMLLRLDATVTICHSRTADLSTYTECADVVALAAGKAGLLTGEMIGPGATVIDFGVNVLDGRLVGDADPSVFEVAGAVTPVPGGTGAVTNAVLMRNTLAAIRNMTEKS